MAFRVGKNYQYAARGSLSMDKSQLNQIKMDYLVDIVVSGPNTLMMTVSKRALKQLFERKSGSSNMGFHFELYPSNF